MFQTVGLGPTVRGFFQLSPGSFSCEIDRIYESLMPISQDLLRVYETGETTVVGFGEAEMPDSLDIAQMRDEIVAMLRQNQSQAIAINLGGVNHVPSAMLGLFASIRQAGFAVHLHNPSRNVKSLLEVTRLNTLFHVHDLGA